MNTLSIDTTNKTRVHVKITIGDTAHTISKDLTTYKVQVLLPLVLQILSEYSLKLHEIDAIEVNPGPGSFTGIRVGIAVANALSYALHIPVNGKVFEKDASLIEPVYVA